MPNLREYVTIGICGGYGNGDYKVSCAVADLSPEDMQELRLAFCYALYAAEDMWRRGIAKRPEYQAKAASPSDKHSE